MTVNVKVVTGVVTAWTKVVTVLVTVLVTDGDIHPLIMVTIVPHLAFKLA
ncbi:MAG: hypothetical protein IGS54_00880 [Elainella sp. C42_A2020_010]|nr:hypothetical protein [Elainella sp. C42_A2020_010]